MNSTDTQASDGSTIQALRFTLRYALPIINVVLRARQ